MQERLGVLTGEERKQFADYTHIMESMPEYKELNEIILRKIKGLKLDALSFMMLALGRYAAVRNSKLPYHEALTLSEHPKIRDIGEKLILLAVTQMAHGVELTTPVRGIIDTWATWRISEITGPERKRGRPHVEKKPFAVWLAYLDKTEKHSDRKHEAIVSELAQEFGLKRRRILSIISENKTRLAKDGRFLEVRTTNSPNRRCAVY
jgi:hypothetical protein